MNKLIELSKLLKATIRSQQRIDISGEVSYHGLAKKYQKHQIQIDLYASFMLVTIAANSELALSVNKPDRMFGFKVPLHMPDSPYPIYIGADAKDFIKSESVRSFLREVFSLFQAQNLSSAESAHFYRNGMRFLLEIDRDIKSIVDSLIQIIDKHSDVFTSRSKASISKANLPDHLKVLFPFLKKYAISDDSKRSQVSDGLSAKKKKELIDIVSPLFPEINAFLDSFGDSPLSEEATLVGNLAELVAEWQASSH